MLRTLGFIAIGLLIGFGLSRFIPELIKAPVEGQKSWQELYGPMIASTLVAIASFCGIYFTTWRNAEQKKLELRVDRLTKRIDTLAALIGALSSHTHIAYRLMLAEEDLDAALKDDSDLASTESAQERVDSMFGRVQESSAEISKLAHMFGAIPYDTGKPIHLGEIVQGWLVFVSRAAYEPSTTQTGRLRAIQSSRRNLTIYLRKTLDSVAYERSKLLNENHIDFSQVDPPTFSKEQYASELSKKNWLDHEDSYGRSTSA